MKSQVKVSSLSPAIFLRIVSCQLIENCLLQFFSELFHHEISKTISLIVFLMCKSIHLELILNVFPPMKLLNPTTITVMKTNTTPFLATENSPRINFLALKLCVSVWG